MTSLPIPSAGIRPIRRGWEDVPLVALRIVAYPLWLWGMVRPNRRSIGAVSKGLMKISGGIPSLIPFATDENESHTALVSISYI